jgi:hypothetical protein
LPRARALEEPLHRLAGGRLPVEPLERVEEIALRRSFG